MLVRACLRDADMSGVRLGRGEPERADIRRANLRGADLHSARMDGTNLREARLGGAFLEGLAARSGPARGISGSRASMAPIRSRPAGVEGLTLKQLDAAVCGRTKLPEVPEQSARWRMNST